MFVPTEKQGIPLEHHIDINDEGDAHVSEESYSIARVLISTVTVVTFVVIAGAMWYSKVYSVKPTTVVNKSSETSPATSAPELPESSNPNPQKSELCKFWKVAAIPAAAAGCIATIGYACWDWLPFGNATDHEPEFLVPKMAVGTGAVLTVAWCFKDSIWTTLRKLCGYGAAETTPPVIQQNHAQKHDQNRSGTSKNPHAESSSSSEQLNQKNSPQTRRTLPLGGEQKRASAQGNNLVPPAHVLNRSPQPQPAQNQRPLDVHLPILRPKMSLLNPSWKHDGTPSDLETYDIFERIRPTGDNLNKIQLIQTRAGDTCYWTKSHAQNHPDWLFIFGENDDDKSGCHNQSTTQAVIRADKYGKFENAIGVRTCYGPGDGYRDATLHRVPAYKRAKIADSNSVKITNDIDEILRKLGTPGTSKYKMIVLPYDGLGTGVAGLPGNARNTHAYLQEQVTRLAENDGILTLSLRHRTRPTSGKHLKVHELSHRR